MLNRAASHAKFSSFLHSMSRRYNSTEVQKVTLFAGDGIGPEISKAVQEVFKAAGVPVQWEPHSVSTHAVSPGGNLVSDEALQSVVRNKVGLKGPLATPIGKGHVSLNLTLRKALKLFANVRPCLSIPGYKTKYDDVDLVIIRENTEGEYSGLEHEVVPGVVSALKVITHEASQRICKYAFEYATLHNRKKVTVVHKANIMKLSDGLFLECAREQAAQYPSLNFEEVLLDAAVMQLAKNPAAYDVMVMPNLYGDIISDLAAGLIGGLGLTPSGNIGEKAAVFEAVHGTAPDIAGQNKANPTALLLSSVMMLRHLGMTNFAQQIERSVLTTISDPKFRTRDLGGSASTSHFTEGVINNL